MAVPKRKVSRARRDKRSANKGLNPNPVGVCSNCAAPKLPHYVCQSCGYFRGEKVLRTKGDRAETRQVVRQAVADRAGTKGTAQAEDTAVAE
ncbi:MAG: 50S ribosomal protein L32 [candidate division TM6 bacterium GW2011_GWF2_43_17]|nr:MAG: 50S ribosomal protein L32 [candidate division TM6 bacterium GW2011_GWF2_43_17]HAU30583.1 50S ribosomal protein L32 [Candidatus Dependentiae bacterium]